MLEEEEEITRESPTDDYNYDYGIEYDDSNKNAYKFMPKCVQSLRIKC